MLQHGMGGGQSVALAPTPPPKPLGLESVSVEDKTAHFHQHAARFKATLRDRRLTSLSPTPLSHALQPEHVSNAGKARGRHVPLLVLILTERRNLARRAEQQQTWLGYDWRRASPLSPKGAVTAKEVNWRYLYIMARDGANVTMDELDGDSVTLSKLTESYDNLVYKTVEALRWAQSRVSFGLLLKTDDDSIVHLSRLWNWLEQHTTYPERYTPKRLRHEDEHGSILYAGRVQYGSQAIRPNYNRSDLWHPEWFPPDFRKWAVPEAAFPGIEYPPHCSGGGYVLGRKAVVKLLHAYSLRTAPVIHLEDVFIGVLANSSGLEPTDLSPHFQDIPRGQVQTAFTFTGRMLVHRVADPIQAFSWLLDTPVPPEAPKAAAVHLKRLNHRRHLAKQQAQQQVQGNDDEAPGLNAKTAKPRNGVRSKSRTR
eukprot:2522433-Pleurochrysis_carterae.AAC.2